MEQSGRPKSCGAADQTKDKGGLEDVYPDILQFGCLRIFRHFDLYLRGREELLVTSRSVWKNYERKKNQRPLPPASPASSELKQTYAGETLFLVGVYARYKFCPYVWLRSQHSQSSASGFDPDVPLLLQTTSAWETNRNLRIWDVVEELVDLNSHSICNNPFEVDFEALRSLPPMERVCMAAAMASFLEVLLMGGGRPSHATALKSDLRRFLELHFKDLRGVLPSSKSDSAIGSSQVTKSYRI